MNETELKLLKEVNRKLDIVLSRLPVPDTSLKRETIESPASIEVYETLKGMYIPDPTSFKTCRAINSEVRQTIGEICSEVFMGRVLTKYFKDCVRQQKGKKGYCLKFVYNV